MKPLLTAALLFAVALGFGSLVPAASAQQPQSPGRPPAVVVAKGPPLGIVPPVAEAKSGGSGAGAGNLSYHGGSVVTSNNHVHAIYWYGPNYTNSQATCAGVTSTTPCVEAGYEGVINNYFSDVVAAGAAGSKTNVYATDNQYCSGAPYGATTCSGNTITYGPVFNTTSDWIVDTTVFPASGCTDSYLPAGSTCLTDTQLTTEIAYDILANGWGQTTNDLYFIFTPHGVGNCSGSSCAYNQYCAYHSNATVTLPVPAGSSTTVGPFLYENMPYAAGYDCNTGGQPKPNGNDADYTINVTSHEHNESITDPLGTAWYDRRGYEDGDKCAWNFGSTRLDGGLANQQIGSRYYYLQQEWSNKNSACVLNMGQ